MQFSTSVADENRLNTNVISSNTSYETATDSLDNTQSQRRVLESCLLVWLDPSIDQTTDDYRTTLTQLQSIVSNITTFTNPDQCVDFLTDIVHQKILLIIAGTIIEQLIPLIHDISQLSAIYISDSGISIHKEWSKDWFKIKGVYTELLSICPTLKQVVKQCDHDSIPISFVSIGDDASNTSVDQLEPVFMYTQIMKEIVLEIDYDEQAVGNLVLYWRSLYVDNVSQLKVIDDFEHEYCSQLAIHWHTREPFVYNILNQALRTLDSDIIIRMGFFIHDLHHQITELHKRQYKDYHEKPFTVYRGQSLSFVDFERLTRMEGGLLSFNSFLSTSRDRQVSLMYAESALGNPETVSILFIMIIDPSIASASFALIDKISRYKDEEEVLFSMHTIFRIGKLTKIDDNSQIYQVELKLTSDDDQQLHILTETIRRQTKGSTGWERLCKLLIRIGRFDMAEELYRVLLDQTFDENRRVNFYNHLGYIKIHQGDYREAIVYCKKALEIEEKAPRPNLRSLAISYSNLGIAYGCIGKYSKALSFHEQTLDIQQHTFPLNQLALAASYSNIALVYANKREYSKSLSLYEKAIKILRKILPSNHPDLASTYSSVGLMHKNMGEYSKALSIYKKSLKIERKTLPSNHPLLAISYNNIGMVYYEMKKYSKALSFLERALEIQQKTLPLNHIDLAYCYNNIGGLCYKMRQYPKALSYQEKALTIMQEKLVPNHPILASVNTNIGTVYRKMERYSEALSFYKTTLEIDESFFPDNHLSLATSYRNIALVYFKVKKKSKALSFYQRAFDMFQRLLPVNHPELKRHERTSNL